MPRADLIALEYASITDAQQVAYWTPNWVELAIIYRGGATPSGAGSTSITVASSGAGNAYNPTGTGTTTITLTAAGSSPQGGLAGGGGLRYDTQTIDRLARREQMERLLREDEEILCLI